MGSSGGEGGVRCDRRSLLAGALASAALPLAGCASDDRIALRWWSPQAAPEQARAYRAQIEAFEASHPGFRVVFEPTSDEGYPAQFAAAFAARQVPNLVTHLPSFAAQTYYAQGLVEPMDAVIDAVGANRFLPDANRAYRAPDGHYAAAAIGGTAVDMLWVRTDLMREAGVAAIPRTWDELRDACRRMQKGAVYGAPLPYGSNSMTSLVFVGFIHRAGGQVFTPDLELTLDSQPTYDALEFYRSMRELCPAGASSFGWADSLNAFVSGATATGIYGGRVLVNVARQNPRIADAIQCVPYPAMTTAIAPWTFNDFPGMFIPKGASHPAETRALAASLYDRAGYIRQLLAAPGHVLPVVRGITDSAEYRGNPITAKFAGQIDRMTQAASQGHNLGFESPAHRPNVKAGEIIASNAIAEMVQRVVIAGEPARGAVQAAAARIDAIIAPMTARGASPAIGDRWLGPILIAPVVLILGAVIAYPLMSALWMSLFAVDTPTLRSEWVGLGNYAALMGPDGRFWAALATTMVWTGATLALQVVIGVGVALLLNRDLWFRNLARSLVLFPYFVSTVVAVLVWRWLFNDFFGLINQALIAGGIIAGPVDWLGTMPNAMASVVVVGAWKFFPFVVIAVLARLQTIPESLYEAARLDGAGVFARFRDVTLPQLADVLGIVILLRAIWDFKEFDLIFLLTGGGPVDGTRTLPLIVYQEAFGLNRMGMASAYAVAMMAVMLCFFVAYRLLARGRA